MEKAKPQQNKFVVYQLLVRLFGNKKTTNKRFGTIEENGVGKFNDITDPAILALKELGVTHIWLTGIISHATCTDFSEHGIPNDHPDIVKGKAVRLTPSKIITMWHRALQKMFPIVWQSFKLW